MQKSNHIPTQLKKWSIPIILGSVTFLSLAHHSIDVWELAAWKVLVLFLVAVPPLAAGQYWLGKKAAAYTHQFPRLRLGLFCLGALLIASFILWRTYHVPASYQTLTITPQLTGDQTLELIELKAHGDVVSLEQASLQSKWQETDGTWRATEHSQPITVSFKTAANAPISVLFRTSHQSGSVLISLGNQVVESDLESTNPSQAVLRLTATYRGIPGGIFIALLILFDLITFTWIILLLLLVQDAGQARRTADEATPHLRSGLTLLLIMGFILHLINLLAVPLIVDGDSPAYLQGTASLLKYGNWDAASMVVGPGTTFLFAPLIFLFGRNPWGIKILLHLIALACIPVCYRLGWQVSRNRTAAFLSGLVAAVTPDIYFYSNYVMPDIANILLVILFCTLLISALETRKPGWIFALLLTGSFATLLRSENILLIVIGAVALAAEVLRLWLQDRSVDLKKPAMHLTLALILAILPILWWSQHNKRLHGFFGMTHYFAVVLYDGWVFYGDASHIPFSDQSSPYAQKLKQATQKYPIEISDHSGFATGWETYPALLKSGYTPEQAMALLKGAAVDSILKDKATSLRLLFMKFKTGFIPDLTHDVTYSPPGEPVWTTDAKLEYFDAENVPIPFLIELQRKVNDLATPWYTYVHPVWILFCMLTLSLSLFRQPLIQWVALVAIVTSRIFIPLTLSIPFWRYTLGGWIPLQILAIGWLFLFANGLQHWFRSRPASDGAAFIKTAS